jgi:hypothetical protein
VFNLSADAEDEQAQCRDMLRELITGSLFPHPSRSFQHYEPVRDPISSRVAACSANLVLMLVLLEGEVHLSEFCGAEETAKNGRSMGSCGAQPSHHQTGKAS